ncbi:MAG TPA: hypothetical protein VHY91_04670 [Pirellulales bacterium]|jgi:hypothetical protein|nr:hypothetical protein [Pirellulales bacterium]
MDKVKVALALLKKHHFWVMTGAVLLLSFIGWFLATSKLWAEYQTSKATIEGEFKALNKIQGEERENQKWIDGLDERTQKLKVKVREAWDKVYIEQKTNVLKWPEVLGPRTVARLERLGPTEEIPRDIRRAYLNYIQKEFPQLLEIVDARDAHAEKKSGVTAPGDNREPHAYKLSWSGTNQREIFDKLNLDSVPSSAKVREIQEDLWVYHALLKIVGNMNEFATGSYNAKVKEIQNLSIGADASGEFQSEMAEGRLDKPEAGSAAKVPNAMAMPASPMGSASASATASRYVDEKGMPLSEGATPPPEFKRMPIVMQLVMDQREILRLLVECANSPLPVEVRHLHIHPRRSSVKGAAQGAAAPEKELNSYDVTVELGGLIYIFNPPDPTKLGGVATVADAAGAPATPAPAAVPGAAPDAKAKEAEIPGAGPADDGKPAAAPDAAADKPDTGTEKAEAGAEADDMEKTDGMKDEGP